MIKVEKARISDAQRIHELVNSFADKGEMLPRALSEIYENLRDFLSSGIAISRLSAVLHFILTGLIWLRLRLWR